MTVRVDAASLSDAYAESSRCNRCGFCQTSCPVYQATRKESSTARGHHYQVQSIVEGRLPASSDIRDSLGECLLCRACVQQCAPKVQTDRVVDSVRQALVKNDWRSSLAGRLVRKVTREPARLRRYVRLAALLQRLPVEQLASWAGPGPARSQSLLPRLRTRSLLQETGREVTEPASRRGQVAYFAGCGVNYLLPEAGQATLNLLTGLGFAVALKDNYCCGLPLYTRGDFAAARLLAIENLKLLGELEVEAIVTDCASCSSFLKGYAELMNEDAVYRTLAADFGAKVLDITEFVVRHALPGNETGLVRPIRVTYHDPCHASRYQGIRDEPRRILQAVQGVTLTEMEEADWCCGGAGAYSVTNPELSSRILDRKIENAARTGADAVVTACPSCMLQLAYGVRRAGLGMRVLHLTQVMPTALPG